MATRLFVVVSILFWFLTIDIVHGRDWYVSASRGAGRSGTKASPAKDLGNILSQLKEGDRIFIAAGAYTGRGDNGCDTLTVPVAIYGGWDEQFTQRDPWGSSRTILSGANGSKNWQAEYRLAIDLSKRREDKPHKIVVDGLIFDNADRNHYASDEQVLINRKASPATGHNPTPESGGLRIVAGKHGDIIVRNCVVMNTAPTVGAFSIWGNQGSKVLVENNLAVNNTGIGFALHTAWHGRDGREMPEFVFRDNTSIFNEKHDPFATYGGSGVKIESKLIATANVFAFNDLYGVDNAKKVMDIALKNNLFAANLADDYLEFDTAIAADDLADESECVTEAADNVSAAIEVPVSPDWSAKNLSRSVIERNAAEARLATAGGRFNELRSMLGLNRLAGDLSLDSNVWLPRISVDDALNAGKSRYMNKFGCQQPAPTTDVLE